jgi:hypothetical protein
MAGPHEARDPAIHVLGLERRVSLTLARFPFAVMPGPDPGIRILRPIPGSR